MQSGEPFRKKGRGNRRSRSFVGAVGTFCGISKTPFKGLGVDGEEAQENFVEEEESEGTEATPAPYDPSLLGIKKQMTQIVASIEEGSYSDYSRSPTLKNPSMKAPDCFDGTQPFKVRIFIQSYQLIFHNDQANFSEDKKFIYTPSFLICRAEKWIEPYPYNPKNQEPIYLLSNWELFKFQLSNLFKDPNSLRQAEAELDGLRIKEGAHVTPYIYCLRSLVSIIGDWGKRAFMKH
ncbi:hypothetical protein O181_098786 [Austropuccinia psidii MF-1]|uniref:Retrotransposon gag domain-containing protein n=1 Tax=Austropuccinia psidii MF-1 TaxID=1389203 RepID=A0A9Q3PG99_9BASI|nr:hypothetical protein [Austropuccinia psidii MF-1]